MANILDFIPPFQETIDMIRARLNADANSGVAPDDPAFLDPAPGGFFWDLTQAPALEQERQYEALNEALAATFPQYAWGTYLDEHALVVGLTRNDSVAASGVVTFTGAPGTLIASGVQVGAAQTDPDADSLIYETIASATIPGGGAVDVAVQARTRGSAFNITAGQLTVLLSGIEGISSVTNAAAISGGADVEADEALLNRILLAWQGVHGGGTVDDYISWALDYPGVGFVRINPLWAGPGTVQVVITDINNQAMSPTAIAGLQAILDPIPGRGLGKAPVGHTVTVSTPAVVPVPVSATIDFLTGTNYSLDGTGGTIAVRGAIEAAIRDYVNTLSPGDDVILQEVVGRIMSIVGVYDTATVMLNGASTNFAITGAQVAQAGTIALTEAYV
jgi:uncharacterized phage protein gp47/JayE